MQTECWMEANHQKKPTDLGWLWVHRLAATIHIYRRHLLVFLAQKAGTYSFTVAWKVEGWVTQPSTFHATVNDYQLFVPRNTNRWWRWMWTVAASRRTHSQPKSAGFFWWLAALEYTNAAARAQSGCYSKQNCPSRDSVVALEPGSSHACYH